MITNDMTIDDLREMVIEEYRNGLFLFDKPDITSAIIRRSVKNNQFGLFEFSLAEQLRMGGNIGFKEIYDHFRLYTVVNLSVVTTERREIMTSPCLPSLDGSIKIEAFMKNCLYKMRRLGEDMMPLPSLCRIGTDGNLIQVCSWEQTENLPREKQDKKPEVVDNVDLNILRKMIYGG